MFVKKLLLDSNRLKIKRLVKLFEVKDKMSVKKEFIISILIVLAQIMMCIFTVPAVLSILVGIFIVGVVLIAVGLTILPGLLMYELSEWLNKFL